MSDMAVVLVVAVIAVVGGLALWVGLWLGDDDNDNGPW